MAKLEEICNFDESKHVVVSAGRSDAGPPYSARLLQGEKALNAAFREQIAWFKKSAGDGSIVLWAFMKADLVVGRKEVARAGFLAEAGEEVVYEDGEETSLKLRDVVRTWSENIVKEPLVIF